jgi:glycosyltransferase involved in cell wall biosynthesis
MNILLIHQAFAGPNDPGGTRHFEIGRILAAHGHRFTIVASPISYLTGEPVKLHADLHEETYDGVRVLRSYVYRSLHRSFVWRIISFITFMFSSVVTALRAGPVDLVIGTTPPIFQAVSAWLVAAIRRRPFLLEVRDLWPEFAIGMNVLTNPLLIRLSRVLEKFLYARATHIVVNSPAYRDYLIGKGIRNECISVICNGVDPGMFDPEDKGERFRKEWKADGSFVVTYAGALGLANDIGTLLRAAARLRNRTDIRFAIVGDGKERRNLERQAAELQLSNVTFTGSRSKTEMKEILGASDACVAILQDIPMFKTTYPNKVFDYMAAGRPTVLAINGVIRDVVEKADGGLFVCPGDDAAIASAVESLAANRERASAMGRSARRYVSENFNRRDQGVQFELLITRLALSSGS